MADEGGGIQDRRVARQGRPVSTDPGTVRFEPRPSVASSQPGLVGLLPVQPEVMRQMMLDVRVRTGEEEGHVAVVEPVHHVRRLPVRAAHFGDLSFTPMIVEVHSFDDQPITHLCPHVSRTPSTVPGTSVARSPLLRRDQRPRCCRVAACFGRFELSGVRYGDTRVVRAKAGRRDRVFRCHGGL